MGRKMLNRRNGKGITMKKAKKIFLLQVKCPNCGRTKKLEAKKLKDFRCKHCSKEELEKYDYTLVRMID
jgi:ribosomal protein S27E